MISGLPSAREETVVAVSMCWIPLIRSSIWEFIPEYFPKEMEALKVKIAYEKLRLAEKLQTERVKGLRRKK
jgi:hypothetical protein